MIKHHTRSFNTLSNGSYNPRIHESIDEWINSFTGDSPPAEASTKVVGYVSVQSYIIITVEVVIYKKQQ